MSKRKQIETSSRCPNGSRRNKKTGNCEARTAKRPASIIASSKSKITLGKSSRCPNGSRKNKKTGLCEPIVRARAAPIIRQSSTRNSPFRFPYNSAEISPANRKIPLYARASSPRPVAPSVLSELSRQRLVDLSPSSPFAQMQNNPSLTRRDLIQFSPDSKNLMEFSPDSKNLMEFSPDLPSSKKVTPKQMSLSSKGNSFPFSQYPLPKSASPETNPFGVYPYTPKNTPYSVPWSDVETPRSVSSITSSPLQRPRTLSRKIVLHSKNKSLPSSASSSSFHSLENSPSEVFLTPESDIYLSPEGSPIILRKSGLSNKLKRKKSDKSSSPYSLPANKDKYSSKRKNTRSMSRSARSFLPENEQRTLQKMLVRQQSKSLEKSMKSRSPSKSPSPKRMTPASPFYELYPTYSPLKVKARKSYDSPLLSEIIANKKQMKEFTRKLKYKKEIAKVRRIVSNSTRKKTPVQSQSWASYLWSKVPKLRDK